MFQLDTGGEVVQTPPGSYMTDDEDPLPVPAQRQVAEKPADARDGLVMALFGLAVVLVSPFRAWMVDRYGPRTPSSRSPPPGTWGG
jgi:MFS family permease